MTKARAYLGTHDRGDYRKNQGKFAIAKALTHALQGYEIQPL